MKNYLAKHYNHYYIQTIDGQTVETTRLECIAPGENPTAENPYKQRWFYDFEAGYIIRLLRNEQGEKLYRDNEASFKKEERYQFRKYACVSKETGNCDSDCRNCQRNRVARTIDLDKPRCSDGENDEESYLDIAAPDAFAEREEKEDQAEEYARLHAVINTLSEKRQKVCRLYFFMGYTAKQIGEMFGVTEAAVLQQISTIKKIIGKLF